MSTINRLKEEYLRCSSKVFFCIDFFITIHKKNLKFHKPALVKATVY